jgi:hypothetical protein
VLATSIFGFVFFTGNPGFHMPASRYVDLIVSLFSLFCYALELERLGRAFMGQETKPDFTSALTGSGSTMSKPGE